MTRDIVRFHTLRELIGGTGPRLPPVRNQKPKLQPRVGYWLHLVGRLTIPEVEFTLLVSRGTAKRALDGLCEQGLARKRKDGAYEAVRKGEQP